MRRNRSVADGGSEAASRTLVCMFVASLGVALGVVGFVVAAVGGLWTMLALGPNDDQEVTYRLRWTFPILALGVIAVGAAWLCFRSVRRWRR